MSAGPGLVGSADGTPPATRSAAVKVMLFAALRRAAGVRETVVEGASGRTVAEVAAEVGERFGLRLGGVMCAVNERYVDPGYELAEGDVLALLPPVSGG